MTTKRTTPSTGKRRDMTADVKLHYSFKKIMSGSDLSIRRLPVMTARSAVDGPLVWLTACSHGDEVSGIVVIQEIFKGLKRRLTRGSIHAFPLMNPIGFETRSRNLTTSREDLNRSYPGDPKGSLGERMADHIFSSITSEKPALVIDLHNDWIESMPYALLDHDPGRSHGVAYRKSIAAGKQSGLCLILDSEEIHGSMSFNLLLNDVPALTLELGKPNVVSEANVTFGVEAIWNVLSHLGMVENRSAPFRYALPPQYGAGNILGYADKPYCSRTGIIRYLAKPGDVVKTGQPIARIVNAFGRLQETITAVGDALVLGHSDSSAAFPGMPIMAFGTSLASPST
jgi:predicted deacylase